MGQVGNVIGNHLGITTGWRDISVGSYKEQKNIIQKFFLIKKICLNFFVNYSIPEFLDEPRNNKHIDQKDRNLQSKLINNPFVANNMIYGETTISEGKQLKIEILVLDSDLLNQKTNEIKDLKKIDSSYLKPKRWKRHLPTTLFTYKNLLQKTPKKFYVSLRKRKVNLILKSFRLAFRAKTTAKEFIKQINDFTTVYKNSSSYVKYFSKRKHYTIKKQNKATYYFLLDTVSENEEEDITTKKTEEEDITTEKKTNFCSFLKKTKEENYPSYKKQKNCFDFLICVKKNTKKYCKLYKDLFYLYRSNKALKNIIFFSLGRKKKGMFSKLRKNRVLNLKAKKAKKKRYKLHKSKKKMSILVPRLRNIKRYPLLLQQFLQTQQKPLTTFPAECCFNLLKCLINGFKHMSQFFYEAQMFFFFLLQTLLLELLRFIGINPKLFFFRSLMRLVLLNSMPAQTIILHRNIFFAQRYLFFQTANAALLSAATSIYKNRSMLFSFVGLHTRNLSASILTNYIVQKLGQYFTIQEIVKPMMYDLKISPLFDGFKIIVAGRITRKERAAFLIKKFGNLPLNKKSATIDYASAFKIMKFGLVGIKVFLYKKNTKPYYYKFNFLNENKNYILFL